MATAQALAPPTTTARGSATAEGSLRTHEGLSDLTKLMVSIAAKCGDDEAAARRMLLLARFRSRDVNQSGGDATADRGAGVDVGRAAEPAPAAAPGKRLLESVCETADDAVPTTAKKTRPGPTAPITPDDAATAAADPGAPKDAEVSVVSPEVSSGPQALHSGDTAPTAPAPPLAASLLAKPPVVGCEAPALVVQKKHPRQEDAQDVGARYQNFIEEKVPSLRMCQMKVMFHILKSLNRGAYDDAMSAREGKDHESARKVLLALAPAVPPEAVLRAYAEALNAHPAEKKLKPTA